MSAQASVVQPTVALCREPKAPRRIGSLDAREVAIAAGLIVTCTVAAGILLLGSAAAICALA